MRKPPRVQQEHLGYIPRIAETSKISNPGYKREGRNKKRRDEKGSVLEEDLSSYL